MADLRQQTIDTYNRSAKELADYFAGIGPRIKYIERALDLAGNPAGPRVLEIGCGDGRDAAEIVKRAGWYQGFDISEGLIDIARSHLPAVNFTVADALDYDYPDNLDCVFAFASLLHLSKEEVSMVLKKVHAALKTEGILYVSLKYRDTYSSEVKKDQFGQRLFYFYNEETIRQLAGKEYAVVFEDKEVRGHTTWLEVALQKQ